MGVNNLLKFRKSINVIYAISYMPPKKKSNLLDFRRLKLKLFNI